MTLWVVLGILLVVTLFMPWVHHYRLRIHSDEISALREKIRQLQIQLHAQSKIKDAPIQEDASPEDIIATPVARAPIPAPIIREEIALPEVHEIYEDQVEARASVQEEAPVYHEPAYVAPKPGIEVQIGARLPVWIGGIALVMAAFFLMKYSVEAGWLTLQTRLVLGGLFGAALVASGQFFTRFSDMPNGERIAQALVGAGIVALYICFFAAVRFDVLPNLAGFIGMVCVTVMAVILSLKHGQPIAVFGLIGGLLTPILIGSDAPSAISLFTYLFVLFAGMNTLLFHQGWWKLALFSVASMIIWALFWLGSAFTQGDQLVIMLFLLGVCASTILMTRGTWAKEGAREGDFGTEVPYVPYMNTAALIGSLVVFALIGQYAKLGLMEWGLFGLLGLAAMTLYAISGRAYAGMLGILSTGTFVLLGHWALSGDVPVKDLLMVFAWIGLLYTVFPAIMMVRTSDPRLWCSIKCGAVFALYVIAYFTLTAAPYDMLERDSTFWSLLALPLCALSVYMVMVIRQHYTADEYIQDYLVAIYALCATAFLSISMAIMLPEAWLPLAFAMQALATVFIFTRTEIDFLQKITLGLIAVFIYVSLPQLGDVFELAVVDRFRAEGRILDNLRVDNFLTYFGLAALLFLASCLLILRKETVYPALQFSLFAAFALLSMSWIYIAGHEMFPQQRGYDFLSSGVISLGFMALGAGLYYAERFTGTAIFTRFSLPIMHLGAVRFAIFCGFLYNPVLGTEHVGALPIINGISVLFGGMLVLSIMAARFLRTGNAAYLYMVFAFFAGLALITFNIRHMFHGDILYGNVPQNAELYTYSAAWLLAGIALLAGGIVWQNKAARFASLGFMVLTILKVFLMDAGSLEGLLRVFSFLGLGVSLLGLSYIYTRFVLNDREHA